MLETLADAIPDRSARGIASALGRLITSGDLAVGTRLPTVRQLSRRLGVSPTTVGEAWKTLADIGAIETLGRNGSFVRQPTGPGGPRRYRRIAAAGSNADRSFLDLSTGTPDSTLLPDLGEVLARVSGRALTNSYLDQPVLPALDDALRRLWPFVPEEITVVDGAMDALDRLARLVLRLGDRVIVEHPTFPPLLDLLEQIGVEVIGVDLDDQGLDVDGFRSALERRPAALFMQPRAHNPTGVTMTQERCRELARCITESTNRSQTDSSFVIIEDDHAGDIASGELHSLGTLLPSQSVHIRSFSKSHGPDLRLAAVGGAGPVVAGVANRRLLGPGWSSRILQAVLVELLDDRSTIETLRRARDEYARRRRRVVDILHQRGVRTSGSDGINLWVAVDDERDALMTLAARGIGAAPGEPFMVKEHHDSLRFTVGLLGPETHLDDVAHAIADAAVATGANHTGQRR